MTSGNSPQNEKIRPFSYPLPELVTQRYEICLGNVHTTDYALIKHVASLQDLSVDEFVLLSAFRAAKDWLNDYDDTALLEQQPGSPHHHDLGGNPPVSHNRALTYWLTGLSGAGKSTLAQALAKHLRSLGSAVCVLDGDELRTQLCKDLGFSNADRAENMRRAAALAQLLNNQGITVIAALISPLAQGRAAAQAVIGADRFVEVYINTPLAVCQQRDPKGLYARAQDNPAIALTGMGSPYEPPTAPDLCIDTSLCSLQKAVARISSFHRR